MSDGADLAMRWARRLVSAFADAGVRHVVVSPGSRSTPLVLAVAAEERLQSHVVVDERAAAFFALGIARITGQPPLVICTSGTAGTHLYPAVVEASLARVPLVVLTADRPPELRGCAAPQTIDQLELFGGHVRHFVELGIPEASPAALGALARVAAQCVSLASWPNAGAVHVNAAFRKPLEPSDDAWRTAPRGSPAPRILAPRSGPSAEAVELVARSLSTSERGIVAAGALPADFPRAELHALVERAGTPLLADTTSQLRGASAPSLAAPGFDAFLRAPCFARDHEPDVVLELGMPLLSPAYGAWLAGHPRCRRIVVSPTASCDPLGGASAVVLSDPAELVREVAARLGPGAPRVAASWRAAFAAADRVVWEQTARALSESAQLLEGDVARLLLERLPDGALLQLGASTPLRDVDRFSPGPRAAVAVLAPRGANGIDGGVASVAGAHVASGRPAALLCGDVALVHDLGGLILLRDVPGPLAVVVVHNDGGHIFDELPIATSAVAGATLSRFFTTPHGLAFGPAAAFVGIAHARVTTRAGLAEALDLALARPGATLVEAVVPAAESAACRRSIRDAVARRLAEARP